MTREESYRRVQRRDSVLCIAISGAFLILFLLVMPFASHSEAQSAGEKTGFIAVCEGDTLWSISASHRVAGRTTSESMNWIVEHNNLTSYVIAPGQIIEVPVQ